MILPPPGWAKGPAAPALLPSEVHLWHAPLSNDSLVAECTTVLSAMERDRAARFAFERDRREYTISHGATRMVLARYCGIAPSELAFERGGHGKPRLVQRFTDFRFNLSHTEGLALIAVTRGRDVGVDVERVDESIAFEEIAEHYFDPRELWKVRVAPAAEKAVRFFEVWTQKEARLKASGRGLAGLDEPSADADDLEVRGIRPAEGYAGAVACAGSDWRLACWEWSL
jgi:4'-phosphopantetheinyl transferase